MEIVEKMSDEKYATVCDAGVELVQQLTEVLKRFGLSSEQGFNVLIVAAAGISAASELTSQHLADGVDSVRHMWRVDNTGDSRELVFDPAGMQQDTQDQYEAVSAN